MNVGKYYVAGIPFDSENSLSHHGVKGMEWNKHKFGLDADTRFIKWINPNDINVGSFGKYGKMAEAAAKQKYGAAAPTPKGRLTTVYNKQSVMNSRDRAVQNMNRQKWNNSPIGKASNFVTGTANKVGNLVGNQDEKAAIKRAEQDRLMAKKAWENGSVPGSRKAYEDATKKLNQAKDAYANHPMTKMSNAAQNVGNWAGQAAQNVGNAVSNLPPVKAAGEFIDKNITGNTDRNAAQAFQKMADDFGDNQYAQRAQKAKEQADAALLSRAGDVAQNVGNTVSGAVQNAGNWIGDRARDVADFVNNSAPAVQNAGNWISDRAQDVGNFVNSNAPVVRDAVSGAVQNAGNWIGDRAQDVGQAAEQARGGIGGFFDRVGNAVGGAAQNVGNWVGDRAQDVGGAVQNAGNWIGDRAQDVGNFVTGNQARDNLQNAQNSFFIGRNGRVNAAQDAYDQTLPGMAENAGKAISGAAQNVGNTVGGAANKAAEGAKGFLNSAGQWVSGAANNVKNTASKAASDAKKGASGFLNSAGQWVSNAAGNMKNAAQNVGNTVGQAAQNVGNTVGQAAEQARGGIGGFFDRVGNAVGNAANSVGDWAGQTAQNVGGAVQNAGNWIGDRAQDVGNFVTGNQARSDLQDAQNSFFIGRNGRVNAAQDAYNQTLPGMAENAAGNVGDWARNTAGNVGNVASQAAQNLGNAVGNVGNWAGQTAGNIGNAAGQVAGNVGNWAGQTAQGIGNTVGQAAGNVGDWASNAAGNVGNWAGQAAQNVGNAAGQAGQWIGGQAQNLADWWNRRNPFVQHSAIDEKPDGVSDAFWEKFTADGGTREDYERDWR